MARSERAWFDQRAHRLRFGWGPDGLRHLAPGASVVVIVDVLSFSTAVDVAVGRGAVILPYRWHDGSEQAYAAANGAMLAGRAGDRGGRPVGYSLRPSSLTAIESGTRLVLPSPNGSALTFGAAETAAAAGDPDAGSDADSTAATATTQPAGGRVVLVGCLRNATAVGREAARLAGDGAVVVIAAGERWRGTTGPLRPALEDLLGAGAILNAAARVIGAEAMSPEVAAATAAHRDAEADLAARLAACGSGRELIGRGFPADVELAAALDASTVVPALVGRELVDRAARVRASASR